ncbi:MAG: hypothetical protein M0C28_33945 [Candidatus Moduliflexus flocculans]|nr:hypothetical protein [Candidatus Moduliflexus flocculans]
MMEMQNDLNQPVQPQSAPKNRSTGALVLFLVFAVPMPACMFIYHFVLWSMEQTAIALGSLGNLAWAGPLGLAAQAIVMTGVHCGVVVFHQRRPLQAWPTRAGWARR